MKSDRDEDQPATLSATASAAAAPTGHESRPTASGTPADDWHPFGDNHLAHVRRYQMIAEHGRGGLGRVSRAHDRHLGRDIAIKELISRGHTSEVRFMREALITARLEHPGIVPVYEAGRWPDGTPFYAMKLVAGRPLRALIAERHTVEERLALLHHVIAVADAIAYAHGLNIIHRDLKPANIIVGDFGETIVIDWGLAKDLGAVEPATVESSPFREHRDAELTAAGSVLGTPSYMPPEQERGEYVDQRADVFAIGAMLWELCSLQKVPPDQIHLRHRMLRRAGIDKDLIVIIDKALARDAEHRYSDAGALAADLKAFRSGARIKARSYSLFAMLAHWTRRHRAVALSLITAAGLAAVGILTYVRHIATERDRVYAANNTLILEQAELLLQRDPTSAYQLLQTYEGRDNARLSILLAQARGLGLSSMRAQPHMQSVIFGHPLADGALITIGGDGTVAKTFPFGRSHVIATGVNAQYTFSHTQARGLIAYACNGAAICVLDTRLSRIQAPPPGTAAYAPTGLAFSPTGSLLAAVSAQGDLSVWRIRDDRTFELRLHTQLSSGKLIDFIDERTLAALSGGRANIFHLDSSGLAATTPSEIAIPGATEMSPSSELHLLAVSTAEGTLVIIDTQRNAVTQQTSLCKGYLNRTHVLAARSAIGYSCQDGDSGTWDLHTNTRVALGHLTGGGSVITASQDNRYLITGGNNGTLLIHDFTTGITSTRLGHANRITQLVAPSPSYPYIESGDAAGITRTWPLPNTAIRVAISRTAQVYRAMVLPNHGPIIAIENSPTIPWRSRDGSDSGELRDHNPLLHSIVRSPTQASFVTRGFDDNLELWSLEGAPSKKSLRTGHGTINDISYISDGTHFIVGSHDGSIVKWAADLSAHRDLGSIQEPVAFIRTLANTSTAIVAGESGTLWLASDEPLTYLGRESAAIVSTVVSRDARWLVVGLQQGTVALYDLRRRQRTTLANPGSWVEFLAFSHDSRELAVSTDKNVLLVPINGQIETEAPGVDQTSSPKASSQHDIPATYTVYSPDGKWLAITTDQGGIWINQRASNRWAYLPGNGTRIRPGNFSEDSKQLSAVDMRNQILTIDMSSQVLAMD